MKCVSVLLAHQYYVRALPGGDAETLWDVQSEQCPCHPQKTTSKKKSARSSQPSLQRQWRRVLLTSEANPLPSKDVARSLKAAFGIVDVGNAREQLRGTNLEDPGGYVCLQGSN